MTARGVAFAGGSITLLLLAAWSLAPWVREPLAPSPANRDEGQGPVAVMVAVSLPPTQVGVQRTASPASGWTLTPVAPTATSSSGVAVLLHQPRFAPRVDVEGEVWAAFAATPRGDPRARWAAVADRLARLGLACDWERDWTGGGLSEAQPEADGDLRLALVLTGDAIGVVRVTAAMVDVRLPLWATAEVVFAPGDPAWDHAAAWSASAFAGPHLLRPGAVVPAACLRVVAWREATPLTVGFSDPLLPAPGGRAVVTFAPKRRERDLDLPPGSLALRCAASGWSSVEIALGAPRAPLRVIELGVPFGEYGTSPAPRSARALGAGGW